MTRLLQLVVLAIAALAAGLAIPACDWSACFSFPCQTGCGVMTGAATIVYACHQKGTTCCMCVRYKYSCTLCGHTIDSVSQQANAYQTCSPNRRHCED